MPPVEVVVTHWKRPDNVARIVEALKGQSVPCTITLCDSHLGDEFALSEETLARADRVHRLEINLGAYNRYVPFAHYDHEFTYLADDDMLPGRRCLEHFLDHATARPFGVLGQNGRRLQAGEEYNAKRVKRTLWMEEVDLTVRGYFVRTEHLHFIAEMRREMGLEHAPAVEDDLLLAVAMQLKAGLRCYLTPTTNDQETSMNYENLPSPHSLSSREDHFARRHAMVRQCRELGWQLYEERAGPKIFGKLRGWVSRDFQAAAKRRKKSSP